MSPSSQPTQLSHPAGLSVGVNRNGSIGRMAAGDIVVNLFPGNEMEGGCTNVYLRRHVQGRAECVPLLGPRSPTRFAIRDDAFIGSGAWQGVSYRIALVLAQDSSWFWHVSVENMLNRSQIVDLIYTQDLALAPYGAIRTNEFYVSQYVDHTPLRHDAHGVVIASRQNQAVSGRFPWSIIGSLRRGVAFATDAMQVHGTAGGAGAVPPGLITGLGEKRLQHEHSMVAIQEERITLAARERVECGFFGSVLADHPSATLPADLDRVDAVLALPEARYSMPAPGDGTEPVQSLFTAAPLLETIELSTAELTAVCGEERIHAEHDEQGRLLSFFHSGDRHVVLRAKELRVQRPHGHLLRTGRLPVPDESALTSTTWMAGVFHSMITQGHVSINRFLSTTHSYIGLFRSHGQRVFVEISGAWHLLDVPSAFEMAPDACRWIYKHAAGIVEVRSVASSDPHELGLEIVVREGAATRFLISHHVALNGDDGGAPGAAQWTQTAAGIAVAPLAGSELGQRFPDGDFLIAPVAGTRFERVGGDELLFVDAGSREQPYVCIVTAPASSVGLTLQGRMIAPESSTTWQSTSLALTLLPAAGGELSEQVRRLGDIVPWFTHNALIHYLSPRGLEQYSGGGWGTRDVSQGPVELLLATGNTAPVRDLLLRVFSAQNPDGDWPQWFMFFERERTIRAGDSHGDIVFWPVLALAQYLIASGDASLLEEQVTFFDARGVEAGELTTVWQHLQRSLDLIGRRVIAGTALAAYGHGDWNDSLQPADPTMREHMCSAWTVTLHRQALITLAQALRQIGRDTDALPLETTAAAIEDDFQRLLLVDGVLTGYAFFEADSVRYLLHPRDATSGVRYSSLAMIHAILEDMLTPPQAREHLQLIDEQLTGPDGVRLFDRPMRYHGGPQQFFQRAESATFFGREIGLMYMHAHLRYAQALAHIGEADRFFKALCQANPIGLRHIVPQATLRQSNCYYSSSDAAFADRIDASEHYDRVAAGTIALDGGWRVYSSGAGIAVSLIVRRFLGLSLEARTISFDPVMPAALTGLQVVTSLFGVALTIVYEVGVSGCGVEAVELNGVALAFEREDNFYRKGAARVGREALVAALAAGRGNNRMRISVG